MKRLFLLLLTACWVIEFSSVLASFRVVCYYGSLSAKRDGEARFLPSNIDPRLCTDFVYAFGQVAGNSVKPIGDVATQYKLYAQMVGLKKDHPHKNVFLSVTNWKWKSENYEQLANAIVDFLRLHKFDGLDISSELPSKDEIQYYSQCIHTIRQVFEKEALLKGVSRLLLTSRLTKVWQNIDNYNVTTINTNLDWINLMTFDFHQKSPSQNLHHSLLFPTAEEPSLNIQTTVDHWVKQGFSVNKLYLGLAFFARTFMMNNDDYVNNMAKKAKTRQLGFPGQFTKTKGLLAYSEICQLKIPEKTVNGVDGPYVVSDTLWAGYDNQQSVSLKVKWAIQNGLGGVSVWSVDFDDFTGKFCGQGPFPLLLAVNIARQSMLNAAHSTLQNRGSSRDENTINRAVHNVDVSLLARKHVSLSGQDMKGSLQSADFSHPKGKPFSLNRQNADGTISVLKGKSISSYRKTKKGSVNISGLKGIPVSQYGQIANGSVHTVDFSLLKRRPVSPYGQNFKGNVNFSNLKRGSGSLHSQNMAQSMGSSMLKGKSGSQNVQNTNGSIHTVDFSLLKRRPGSLQGQDINGSVHTVDFSLLKRPGSRKNIAQSMDSTMLKGKSGSQNVQNTNGSIHTVDFSLLSRRSGSLQGQDVNGSVHTIDFSLLKRPGSRKNIAQSMDSTMLKGKSVSHNVENTDGSMHTVDFSLLRRRPESVQGQDVNSSMHTVDFSLLKRPGSQKNTNPTPDNEQSIGGFGETKTTNFVNGKPGSSNRQNRPTANPSGDLSIVKGKSRPQYNENTDGSMQTVDFSSLKERISHIDSKTKTSVQAADFSTLRRQQISPPKDEVKTSVHTVDFSMFDREPVSPPKSKIKTSVHTVDFSMFDREPVPTPKKDVKTSVHTVDFSMFDREPVAPPEHKVKTSVHSVDFSMLMEPPVPTPKHKVKTSVHTVDFSMLMNEPLPATTKKVLTTTTEASTTPRTTTTEATTTTRATTTTEPTTTTRATTTTEPTTTTRATTTTEPTTTTKATTTTEPTTITKATTTTEPTTTTLPPCMLSREEPTTIKPHATKDEIRSVRLAAILKKTTSLQLVTKQKENTKFLQFCKEMEDDFYNHWNKCGKYVLCINGSTFVGTCIQGFKFNLESVMCEEDSMITCTDSPEPPVTTVTTVTTKSPPVLTLLTTKEMLFKDFCIGKPDDYYAHPVSCKFYALCLKEEYFLGHCQPGYYFNPGLKMCDVSGGKTCLEVANKEVEEREDQIIFKRKCEGIANGKFPHPSQCNLFILCLNQRMFIGRCQQNSHFSPELKMCDHSTRLDCKDKDGPPTSINLSYVMIMEFSTALITQISQEGTCKGMKDGEYIHPTKCGLFILCLNQRMYIGKCPGDSLFSAITRMCEPAPNVDCSANRYLHGSTIRNNDRPGNVDLPSEEYPTLDGNCAGIANGEYPHPTRCDQFIMCFSQQMLLGICPKGSLFSAKTRLCGHPENSDCKVVTSKKGLVKQPTFDGKCKGVTDGQYPHPAKCSMFLLCFRQKMFLGICPGGKLFSQNSQRCEEPTEANCDDQSISIDLVNRWDSPVLLHNIYIVVPTVNAKLPSTSTHIGANLEKFCLFKDDGLYQHPLKCRNFIQCSNWRMFIKYCPEELIFNIQIKQCDYSYKVQCSDRKQVLISNNGDSGEQLLPSGHDTNIENRDKSPTSGRIPVSRVFPTIYDRKKVPKSDSDDSREPQLPSGHGTHVEIGDKSSTSGRFPDSTRFPTLYGQCQGFADGEYPHPHNCNKFILCFNQQMFIGSCPPGTLFSFKARFCDHQENVDCTNRHASINTDKTSGDKTPSVASEKRQFPIVPEIQIKPSAKQPTYKEHCQGVSNGEYPHPTKCGFFILCFQQRLFIGKCSGNMLFSTVLKSCTNPSEVNCEAKNRFEERASTTQASPSIDRSLSTRQPSLDGNCKGVKDGEYPHPTKCALFILCFNQNMFLGKCQNGTLFSAKSKMCDLPVNVDCGGRLPGGTLKDKQELTDHINKDKKLHLQSNFEGKCVGVIDGQYPHPTQCAMFILCFNHKILLGICPGGRYFSPETRMCDDPVNVNCKVDSTISAHQISPEERNSLVVVPNLIDSPSKHFDKKDPSVKFNDQSLCLLKEDGIYAHPFECNLFLQCSNWQTFVKKCPGKLHFSTKINRCDYSHNVVCADKKTYTESRHIFTMIENQPVVIGEGSLVAEKQPSIPGIDNPFLHGKQPTEGGSPVIGKQPFIPGIDGPFLHGNQPTEGGSPVVEKQPSRPGIDGPFPHGNQPTEGGSPVVEKQPSRPGIDGPFPHGNQPTEGGSPVVEKQPSRPGIDGPFPHGNQPTEGGSPVVEKQPSRPGIDGPFPHGNQPTEGGSPVVEKQPSRPGIDGPFPHGNQPTEGGSPVVEKQPSRPGIDGPFPHGNQPTEGGSPVVEKQPSRPGIDGPFPHGNQPTEGGSPVVEKQPYIPGFDGPFLHGKQPTNEGSPVVGKQPFIPGIDGTFLHGKQPTDGGSPVVGKQPFIPGIDGTFLHGKQPTEGGSPVVEKQPFIPGIDGTFLHGKQPTEGGSPVVEKQPSIPGFDGPFLHGKQPTEGGSPVVGKQPFIPGIDGTFLHGKQPTEGGSPVVEKQPSIPGFDGPFLHGKQPTEGGSPVVEKEPSRPGIDGPFLHGKQPTEGGSPVVEKQPYIPGFDGPFLHGKQPTDGGSPVVEKQPYIPGIDDPFLHGKQPTDGGSPVVGKQPFIPGIDDPFLHGKQPTEGGSPVVEKQPSIPGIDGPEKSPFIPSANVPVSQPDNSLVSGNNPIIPGMDGSLVLRPGLWVPEKVPIGPGFNSFPVHEKQPIVPERDIPLVPDKPSVVPGIDGSLFETITPQKYPTIEGECQGVADGEYPHPHKCNMFIMCFNQQMFFGSCPHGTLFSFKIRRCDYSEKVNCIVVEKQPSIPGIDGPFLHGKQPTEGGSSVVEKQPFIPGIDGSFPHESGPNLPLSPVSPMKPAKELPKPYIPGVNTLVTPTYRPVPVIDPSIKPTRPLTTRPGKPGTLPSWIMNLRKYLQRNRNGDSNITSSSILPWLYSWARNQPNIALTPKLNHTENEMQRWMEILLKDLPPETGNPGRKDPENGTLSWIYRLMKNYKGGSLPHTEEKALNGSQSWMYKLLRKIQNETEVNTSKNDSTSEPMDLMYRLLRYLQWGNIPHSSKNVDNQTERWISELTRNLQNEIREGKNVTEKMQQWRYLIDNAQWSPTLNEQKNNSEIPQWIRVLFNSLFKNKSSPEGKDNIYDPQVLLSILQRFLRSPKSGAAALSDLPEAFRRLIPTDPNQQILWVKNLVKYLQSYILNEQKNNSEIPQWTRVLFNNLYKNKSSPGSKDNNYDPQVLLSILQRFLRSPKSGSAALSDLPEVFRRLIPTDPNQQILWIKNLVKYLQSYILNEQKNNSEIPQWTRVLFNNLYKNKSSPGSKDNNYDPQVLLSILQRFLSSPKSGEAALSDLPEVFRRLIPTDPNQQILWIKNLVKYLQSYILNEQKNNSEIPQWTRVLFNNLYKNKSSPGSKENNYDPQVLLSILQRFLRSPKSGAAALSDLPEPFRRLIPTDPNQQILWIENLVKYLQSYILNEQKNNSEIPQWTRVLFNNLYKNKSSPGSKENNYDPQVLLSILQRFLSSPKSGEAALSDLPEPFRRLIPTDPNQQILWIENLVKYLQSYILNEQKNNSEIPQWTRVLFNNLYKNKSSPGSKDNNYDPQVLLSILQRFLSSPKSGAAALSDLPEPFRRLIPTDPNQQILWVKNLVKYLQSYILLRNEPVPQNGQAKPNTKETSNKKELNDNLIRMFYPLIFGQNGQTLPSGNSEHGTSLVDSSISAHQKQDTNSLNICMDASDGFYIHPTNCYMYIKCQKQRMTLLNCPKGQKFDCISRHCRVGAVTCRVGDIDKKEPPSFEKRASSFHVSSSGSTISSSHETRSIDYCTGVQDGPYIHPSKCNIFILCSNGRAIVETCPAGLLFNPILKHCDYSRNVNCIDRRPLQEVKESSSIDTVSSKNTPDINEMCNQRNDGYYSHPLTCNKYIICLEKQTYQRTCPSGLLFDSTKEMCDYANKVKCRR